MNILDVQISYKENCFTFKVKVSPEDFEKFMLDWKTDDIAFHKEIQKELNKRSDIIEFYKSKNVEDLPEFCDSSYEGDIIYLYDDMTTRWMLE
jgi:hypothetical protein